MSKNFGDYLREIRLKEKITLREFCKKNEYDSAYISRLENNILLPPDDNKKIKKLLYAYSIREKSEDWDNLQTLASISKRELPKNLNQRVINFLPAFFRKASKKKVNEKDVKKLVSLIKGKE